MDPKLLKLIGGVSVYRTPIDDAEGGGSADNQDEDGEQEVDEESDEDDPEDTEEDSDEDDDDDGDETEEDGDEEEDDADLGKRAQKRIGKLVKERNSVLAENKRLKSELEEAQKLSGDDGKAILSAAARTGILPGLMTKAEAEAFDNLSRYPRVIETYQDWLDEHDQEDQFGDGDDAMSYGQVKKRVRRLTAELEELKDQYGDRQKELRQKVKQIFALGLEAYRKGAKAEGDGEKAKAKKKVQKPSAHPHGTKPVAKSGKKTNWGDVSGNDSFVKMIAASQKKD